MLHTCTVQRYEQRPARLINQLSAGAWLLDDTSYYQGKFITIGNNVHSFLASVQKASSSPFGRIHLQLLAASYQHAILRDAYAIAKALNRILILPPLYAWSAPIATLYIE